MGFESKLSGLDVLRGIAVQCVVFAHFTGGLIPVQMSLMLGNLGVIIFFFLSGFLMDRNLARDPRIVGFVIRRAFRILPMYWASIAINAATSHSWSIYQIVGNATFTAPILGVERLSGVYWTLYVEVAFYCLAPFLRLLGEIGIRSSPFAFASLLALLFFIFKGVSAAPFYMVFCMIGMQFGSVIRCGKSLWLMPISVLATISVSLLFSDIFWYLAISAILGSALLATAIKLKFDDGLLALCGDVSYSWYLLHTVIGIFVINYLAQSQFTGWASVAIAFSISFSASVVAFNAIEKPFIGMGRRLLSATASAARH